MDWSMLLETNEKFILHFYRTFSSLSKMKFPVFWCLQFFAFYCCSHKSFWLWLPSPLLLWTRPPCLGARDCTTHWSMNLCILFIIRKSFRRSIACVHKWAQLKRVRRREGKRERQTERKRERENRVKKLRLLECSWLAINTHRRRRKV